MDNFLVKQAKNLFSDKISITQKITTIVIFAGMGVGSYYGINAIIKKIKSNSSDKKYGEGDADMYAVQLKNAMSPSGIEWLSGLDGTSIDSLYKIAKSIKSSNTDFKDVIKSYKSKYSESLVDQLSKELNPDELRRFNIFAGVSNTQEDSVIGNESSNVLISTSNAKQYANALLEDVHGFGKRNASLYLTISLLSKNNLKKIAIEYNKLSISLNGDNVTLLQDLEDEYLYGYFLERNGERIALNDLYIKYIKPKLI